MEGSGQLTETERRVLNSLARGMSNDQISEHLNYSKSAVQTYVNKVYDVLNLETCPKSSRRTVAALLYWGVAELDTEGRPKFDDNTVLAVPA